MANWRSARLRTLLDRRSVRRAMNPGAGARAEVQSGKAPPGRLATGAAPAPLRKNARCRTLRNDRRFWRRRSAGRPPGCSPGRSGMVRAGLEGDHRIVTTFRFPRHCPAVDRRRRRTRPRGRDRGWHQPGRRTRRPRDAGCVRGRPCRSAHGDMRRAHGDRHHRVPPDPVDYRDQRRRRRDRGRSHAVRGVE